MSPDQNDPLAWSNETIRMVLIQQTLRINALEQLLIANGILLEGQLDTLASQENADEVMRGVAEWLADRRYGSGADSGPHERED